MQKTKLAIAIAMTIATTMNVANAEPIAKVFPKTVEAPIKPIDVQQSNVQANVQTKQTLAPNETLVEDADYSKMSTIGRIAEKQKRLAELKLDNDIADAKAKNIKSVSAPLPPVAIPAPGNPMPLIKPTDSDDDIVVTAVYGKVGNLKADIIAGGRTMTVSKGAVVGSGQKIEGIYSDHVTVSGSKKSSDIYLKGLYQTTASTGTQNGANGLPMPGLPVTSNYR